MAATEDLIDAIRARVGNVERLGYRIVVALTDNDDTIAIMDGDGGISVEAGGGQTKMPTPPSASPPTICRSSSTASLTR